MTSPNVVHGFPSGLSVRADGRTNEHLADDTQESRSEYPSWMAYALKLGVCNNWLRVAKYELTRFITRGDSHPRTAMYQ